MWDGVDRRKFRRAEYPCLIIIRKKLPPTQVYLTHTETIGIGGVGIVIPEKIEPITEVDLELDLKDTLPNIFAKGTVSWVKEIPAQRKKNHMRYKTGIRFVSLKDEYRRRVENIVDHLLTRGR